MTNTTTITVETVTPELAAQWLRKNTHNRNLKERNLQAMVGDMKAGNWKFNGEPIKFAKDGTLLDGQHRLTAVAQSGLAQDMLIVRGLDKGSQHTMDAGAVRSAADALKLRGEKNCNTLASGIRLAMAWEKGIRKGIGEGTRGLGKVTTSTILDYLDEHPELRFYAKEATRLVSRCSLPASALFLLVKLFYEINEDDCEWFFDRLTSHEGLRGDPIYELDKALTKADMGSVKVRTSWRIAVTIKAWNKFRSGESMSVLRYSPGGANPERFPEPV